MMLTPEQLAELRDAALCATPQDIDTAETIDTAKDGGRIVDCPVCNGDGYAVLEGEYCNYDSAAIGVQFYGIGNEHGAAERYFRAARPETVLQLLAHIDAQQARIAELEKDAARYPALRDAVIAATAGIKHQIELAITQAMRESHASGHGAELTTAAIDSAIDAAMQPSWPEDTSDYGSRIAVVGQNGNDGLHYQEQEGGNDGSA